MKAFCVTLALVSCVGCTSKEGPPPAPLTEAQRKDLAAVVEGNNEFAFELYQQLAQKPGNKFFSPYSVSAALGMTFAGARGNTAKEMAQTLHFTLDNERLHPAFGELIRKVQGVDKKRNYELAVANSLWGNKTGLSLDPKFLRITQTDYQAEFQFLDFVNDAQSAGQSINTWVKDKTNKKIANLIPKGLFTNKTRLVLVNAIYFKAEWSEPFPKEATNLDNFTLPGGTAVKVPMMNNATVADYMANADFQLADFRYKDNELSMVVILPKKKDGLAEVEKKLSARSLSEALALVKATSMQVALPKFKMTEMFALGGELAKLGMEEAFNGEKPDFRRMGKADGPKGTLYISEVVHKAFVEVNEQGTEAAAATGVAIATIESKTAAPIRFGADHPFLFLVRHNATGSILFLGRVSDPRGE